ncbi:MAG: hypothetical protein ABW224_15350 [Kibdelosporangium sp.]
MLTLERHPELFGLKEIMAKLGGRSTELVTLFSATPTTQVRRGVRQFRRAAGTAPIALAMRTGSAHLILRQSLDRSFLRPAYIGRKTVTNV